MLALPQVVAFDVDPGRLLSIQDAFPGCRIEAVNGAIARTMASTWYPRAIDLVVLGAVGDGVNALGLASPVDISSTSKVPRMKDLWRDAGGEG